MPRYVFWKSFTIGIWLLWELKKAWREILTRIVDIMAHVLSTMTPSPYPTTRTAPTGAAAPGGWGVVAGLQVGPISRHSNHTPVLHRVHARNQHATRCNSATTRTTDVTSSETHHWKYSSVGGIPRDSWTCAGKFMVVGGLIFFGRAELRLYVFVWPLKRLFLRGQGVTALRTRWKLIWSRHEATVES